MQTYFSGENRFKKKLQDTTCYENTEVSFEVEVVDTKAPFQWFHNGKEIREEDDKYEVKDLGKGVHRLTIKSAQSDDEGEIKVQL